MEIGTGIAVAGVWVFAGLVAHSTSMTNRGFWSSIVISVAATAVFMVLG